MTDKKLEALLEARRDRRYLRKQLAAHIVKVNRIEAGWVKFVNAHREGETVRLRRAHRRLLWLQPYARTRRHRRASWAAMGHDRPMWEPKVKTPSIPAAVYAAVGKAARRRVARDNAFGWVVRYLRARA